MKHRPFNQKQPARPRRRGPLGRKGFALLFTLFMVAALSLIAAGLGRESRVDVALAAAFKEKQEAYFLARSGISYGMAMLKMDDTPNVDGLDDLWRMDGSVSLKAADYGQFRVKITDAERRVNMNRAGESCLKSMLLESGVEMEKASILTESLLDWIDDNSLHRVNGAEDAYYQSQNPPYKAKNGPIDSLSELFLIRGFEPDIYYGRQSEDESKPDYGGIEKFVTIYGSGQINVNTAPYPALRCIPGIGPSQARLLLEYRRREDAKPLASVAEVMSVIGKIEDNANPEDFSRDMAFQSSHFEIEAIGELNNLREQRTIRTVVRRRGKTISPVYWCDNG